MLATSILIVVAVVAATILFIAARPGAFRIARTIAVAAPAEKVYALVADLHAWEAWNPFEKQDPSTTKTFDGPEAGVGSSFHFAGRKAGEGRMTITELVPSKLVVVRAEFIKPFAATNRVEFTIAPGGRGVTLTWSMSGTNGFAAKALSAVGVLEKMLGGSFEQGLADIKALAESPSGAAAATHRHGPVLA